MRLGGGWLWGGLFRCRSCGVDVSWGYLGDVEWLHCAGRVWPARMVSRVLYWGARRWGRRVGCRFLEGLKNCIIDGELDDEQGSCEVWLKYEDVTFVRVEGRKLVQDCCFPAARIRHSRRCFDGMSPSGLNRPSRLLGTRMSYEVLYYTPARHSPSASQKIARPSIVVHTGHISANLSAQNTCLEPASQARHAALTNRDGTTRPPCHIMSPPWLRTLLLLSACGQAVVVESAHLGHARQADTPKCKAVPSSADWPSPDTWKALNKSIGGRLLQPTPLGAVCHPGHASYSAAQCPVVQAAWFAEPLHSEDPVSAYWSNWSRDTCLPDPRAPCSSAGYPVYVVNATTAEHVKAGVDFGLLTSPSWIMV